MQDNFSISSSPYSLIVAAPYSCKPQEKPIFLYEQAILRPRFINPSSGRLSGFAIHDRHSPIRIVQHRFAKLAEWSRPQVAWCWWIRSNYHQSDSYSKFSRVMPRASARRVTCISAIKAACEPPKPRKAPAGTLLVNAVSAFTQTLESHKARKTQGWHSPSHFAKYSYMRLHPPVIQFLPPKFSLLLWRPISLSSKLRAAYDAQ